MGECGSNAVEELLTLHSDQTVNIIRVAGSSKYSKPRFPEFRESLCYVIRIGSGKCISAIQAYLDKDQRLL
jgi:hypothetical protein